MCVLEFKNVSKISETSLVISDLSFKLSKAESLVIKCSNEVTELLMNIIQGKIKINNGEIVLYNCSIKTPEDFKKQHVAVVGVEEGYYNRLKVKDYIRFFKDIGGSDLEVETILNKFGLGDLEKTLVGKLNYSQKRLLSIARAVVSGTKLIIIHEPTYNLNRFSCTIVRESVSFVKELGTSILAFTDSLEDALLFGTEAFSLNDKGFCKLTELEGSQKNEEDEMKQITENLQQPDFKVNKISAKLEDKIMLFNPTEIDYIEAQDGVSYLQVNGENFTCTQTLSSLEKQLKFFGFFRCHRSYLVNLQKVREVITWTRNSYSLVLDNKAKSSIPLSKARVDELKQIIDL